jgi:hypothetical protein
VPFILGFSICKIFDFVALVTHKKFPISSIRVRKFCSDSVYNTAVQQTGFVAPVVLTTALERTIRHEFIEKHADEHVFLSE